MEHQDDHHGDTTQIDLPRGQKSGLVEALRILDGVEGIGFVNLRQKDIVRHKLVTRIVNAFEAHDRQTNTPHEPAAEDKEKEQ